MDNHTTDMERRSNSEIFLLFVAVRAWGSALRALLSSSGSFPDPTLVLPSAGSRKVGQGFRSVACRFGSSLLFLCHQNQFRPNSYT
jgi:hypothetical protein